MHVARRASRTARPGRSPIRLHWEVAVRGYRRFASYRAATWAGVFTNTAFGFMRAYVLVAVFAARPTVAGYDESDALTYVFIGQGMLMTVYLWGWWEIALQIRSGEIVTDLTRPFDFQLYWLARDLGRALYHAVFRGVPPFVVGALVFDLRLPDQPAVWLLFPLSVALAVSVSFALRFMVNLAAFWLFDYRGVGALFAGVWTFLSGFAVPVAFFPDTLRLIANLLPFRAFLQTPVDVFLGKEDGLGLVLAISIQAAWALALLGVGRIMLASARRRLVVQGG